MASVQVILPKLPACEAEREMNAIAGVRHKRFNVREFREYDPASSEHYLHLGGSFICGIGDAFKLNTEKEFTVIDERDSEFDARVIYYDLPHFQSGYDVARVLFRKISARREVTPFPV